MLMSRISGAVEIRGFLSVGGDGVTKMSILRN